MTTSPLEDRVADVLGRQADRVIVPPPDPRSVLLARSRPSGAEPPGWDWRRLALATAIGIVALAGVGLGLLLASPGTVTTEPASDVERPFAFDTDVGARLEASTFTVDAEGRSFSPTADVDVTLHGDPGTAPAEPGGGHTTLELTWFEAETEMRVYFTFASDDVGWWVSDLRVYDGRQPGDWIYLTAPEVRAPLGQPYTGDLDLGPLRITDLVLEAFVPRATSCDGSGVPGQLLLDLSGARPVAGEYIENDLGGATGYATTVAILDASTCEPIPPSELGVDFRGSVADEMVAQLDEDEVVFDPSWVPGEIYVSLIFTGVGRTVVSIEAVEPDTGAVVASIDIPVTVTESGGG